MVALKGDERAGSHGFRKRADKKSGKKNPAYDLPTGIFLALISALFFQLFLLMSALIGGEAFICLLAPFVLFLPVLYMSFKLLKYAFKSDGEDEFMRGSAVMTAFMLLASLFMWGYFIFIILMILASMGG